MKWNKNFVRLKTKSSAVIVTFQDGTTAEGKLLVGADGATSKIRNLTCPDTGALNELPIRFLGATVKLSPVAIAPLRSLDPLLFQGCHPETGTFLWFSTLDTPEVNGSKGFDDYYSAQLNVSWPVRSPEDEVPDSNEGKLAKMKMLSEVFEGKLKTAIQNIPDGTDILEVKIADWPCLEWPNSDGRVTLLGDAAHAMTMCKFQSSSI